MVFYDAGLNDTAFRCSPSYKPKTKEGGKRMNFDELREEVLCTIKDCAKKTREAEPETLPEMMSALAELITAAQTLKEPISCQKK